ncbi:MAG: sensor histidine kinase [Alphaproteobacteria bacterium]|nr:sensor histidine kinase [Alphaproteobacteria bacterium]
MKGDAVAAEPMRSEDDDLDVSSIRLLELRHRIKNLLGITQAVANQTLRSGRSVDEARVALDGRLAAMGEAVDMLLQTGWTAGDLGALVRRALLEKEPRVSLAGPHVRLGPDAVMALTLVVHELESNAVKYGALASPEGRVAVAWSIEPRDGADWLRLEWAEHDGPPCEIPSRKGFGSRMMAKLIGGRLRGAIETDYSPDGLRWRLTAPLASLAP